MEKVSEKGHHHDEDYLVNTSSALTDSMGEAYQGRLDGAGYGLIVAGPLDEVDIVLVLKEGSRYGTATVVHISEEIIETGELLQQVLSLA